MDIELITKEQVKLKGIRVKYTLLECTRCGKQWGKAFYDDNQTIKDSDLVCLKCATDSASIKNINK